jgi:hypothetical protein
VVLGLVLQPSFFYLA